MNLGPSVTICCNVFLKLPNNRNDSSFSHIGAWAFLNGAIILYIVSFPYSLDCSCPFCALLIFVELWFPVYSIQCGGTGSLWAVWQCGLWPVVQESTSWGIASQPSQVLCKTWAFLLKNSFDENSPLRHGVLQYHELLKIKNKNNENISYTQRKTVDVLALWYF